MLVASAAIAIALGGCLSDGVTIPDKAMKQLSPEMIGLLAQKNMPKESPVLVRIFKEESELEVWKQDTTGQFALLKAYPICRWSGELGPKIKEGDRQAPEGFYTITPGQMNPNSQYFLSFNLGYPNAFDKAHDRTGAHLMVHGDCSSRGCYAMTDEQIGEIYALARESFFGGQRAFQVQAYPFRMTALNLAKHRNSPHLAFWRQLKRGNDHFEVSRREPKVDVCEKRYVFDAVHPSDPSASLRFDAKSRCPAYQVSPEIAEAVEDKQQRDERQIAELIGQGTPAVAVRTGADGGMHPVFLAKLKRSNDAVDNDGRVRMASTSGSPEQARLGRYTVVPPRNADLTGSTAQAGVQEVSASNAASAAEASRTAPQRKAGYADTKEASLTDRLFGGWFKRDETPPPPARTNDSRTATASPASRPIRTATPAPATERSRAATTSSAALAAPQQSPGASRGGSVAELPATATAEAAPKSAAPGNSTVAGSSLMSGAQPVLSSSFSSRFDAFR